MLRQSRLRPLALCRNSTSRSSFSLFHLLDFFFITSTGYESRRTFNVGYLPSEHDKTFTRPLLRRTWRKRHQSAQSSMRHRPQECFIMLSNNGHGESIDPSVLIFHAALAYVGRPTSSADGSAFVVEDRRVAVPCSSSDTAIEPPEYEVCGQACRSPVASTFVQRIAIISGRKDRNLGPAADTKNQYGVL